jgi:hypothetical protein
LPIDSRRKITIVVADITGIAKELTSAIESLSNTDPAPIDFLRNATGIVDDIDVGIRHLNLGNDYAFVCSQLVMSQLTHLYNRFIEETFRALTGRVGVQESSIPRGGSLGKALMRLSSRLEVEHVRFLAQLASLSGGVHLADTYNVREQRDGYKTERPFIAIEEIDSEISRHFAELRPKTSWTLGRPGTDGMFTDKVFTVVSNALSPRRQEISG